MSDDIPMGVVDRQVLAAIEARTQQGGAPLSPGASPAPAPLPAICVQAPADSGVALKLAQHKLDNNDPSSAFSLAESVIKRQDPHEPDALDGTFVPNVHCQAHVVMGDA